VNTPSNESCPVISADGSTLYFGSDRADGLGGFDLYYAVRTRM
jgi:hypothetical protein